MVETMEKTLRSRLATLLGREEKISADLHRADGALPADWEEQAVALENSEVLSALDASTRHEISQIQEALGRIKMGSYGMCRRCGEKIPDGRLRALPYASTCVACA